MMSLLSFWAKICNDFVGCDWFRNLSDFIKNILISVLKMKKGLTGLERSEGE